MKFRIETQTQKKIGSKVRTSETSETFYDGDEEEGLSLYIKGEVEITEKFTEQETVCGGLPGLKLYIKVQVMKLVFKFEDSGTEIKSIALTNRYVSKRNQGISMDFRHKNVWNTL